MLTDLDQAALDSLAAQLGGVEPVLAVVADVRDLAAEQLAAPPWPLNKTTSVDKCATAFVKGIEGRKDRVYWPRWVALSRWLKPVLSTRLGEFPVLRATAGIMPQMDAEVAALGRSTSAYNQELGKA